ncbi:hypothetical protein FJ364_05620, partial [Candidatus Dependentiae bacterium]|nr:hypothetical protein [Candidatus Dependentiae bacterium]
VNIKSLTQYLDNGKNNIFLPLETETLSHRQIALERLMLSLRQVEGMNLHDMIYCVGEENKEALLVSLKELESMELLQMENNRIKLTLRGMILENEVVLRLI